MKEELFDLLRSAIPETEIGRHHSGAPMVTPRTVANLQLACRLAARVEARLRVQGHGSWLPDDAPCDLVIATDSLNQVSINADDLVAEAGAGVPRQLLQRSAAEHGMWLAIDPPGYIQRTLGSIVATGTSGPLRCGLGPIRDHILGLTVVTAEGNIVTSGGQVVKNVAGYDLAKLQAGGFGAFGIIAKMHLRLRALPRADVTMVAGGSRDKLTACCRDMLEDGVETAAMELLSPAVAGEDDWQLAARLLGTEGGVSELGDRIASYGLDWRRLSPDQARNIWLSVASSGCAGPVSLRLGVLPTGIDEMIDLVSHRLDDRYLTAGVLCGGLRWSGAADPKALGEIRRALALREIPVTLERAPWPVRSEVGHFGSYREGAGMLVKRLRQTFDPDGRLAVTLDDGT